LVASAFLGLCLLLPAGGARPWAGEPARLHAIAGHLMLPLVASAAGLWLGAGLPRAIQSPGRTLIRLLFLLLLCLCCLSNTRTGYLGPSRIDPVSDPETKIRFIALHEF